MTPATRDSDLSSKIINRNFSLVATGVATAKIANAHQKARSN
jgi:hypothetical protein